MIISYSISFKCEPFCALFVVYERIITAGFDLLEGNETTKAMDDLEYLAGLIEESNGLKVSPALLQRVLLSIATLQWFLFATNCHCIETYIMNNRRECAKLASKDIRMLHETLRQVGLWEEMIICFINVINNMIIYYYLCIHDSKVPFIL